MGTHLTEGVGVSFANTALSRASHQIIRFEAAVPGEAESANHWTPRIEYLFCA